MSKTMLTRNLIGCPSNTQGNLSPGYQACTSAEQGDCLHSWDIPMPKGVKSGNAILSWTWYVISLLPV
jgi:hypothetical protein